ncbi:MAG: EMC3/TMCO1 family protein [Candidatus Woesearchaeota archaeon]
MVFESVLNPVFSPLLALNPALAILIVSAVLTLLTTLIYKWTTPQARLKELKAEMKGYQDKIKKLKDNPKKAMEVQKLAMAKNMEYMKHSFKPMIYTFIPIILVFGWMSAHLAFEPVYPGVPFEVTASFKDLTGTATLSSVPELTFVSNQTQDLLKGQTTWKLKGDAGTYNLAINYDGQEYSRNVIISSNRGDYAPVDVKPAGNMVKSIHIANEPLHPLGSLSLFGWNPGWIGVYIITSIIFSFAFRRVLKLS